MWVRVAAVCGEHQLMPIEARCGVVGGDQYQGIAPHAGDYRALRATLLQLGWRIDI